MKGWERAFMLGWIGQHTTHMPRQRTLGSVAFSVVLWPGFTYCFKELLLFYSFLGLFNHFRSSVL